MVYRLLNFIKIFLFLILFISCIRKDEECFTITGVSTIDNLVIITPLQTTYNQGDVITVKMNIPSKNNYFTGTASDIFLQTQDLLGTFILRSSLGSNITLFTDNIVTYIKGNQDGEVTGKFNVPYNWQTDAYEFEVKVKLNRLGNYTLNGGRSSDDITFVGSDKCNVIILYTNKLGVTLPNDFNFTVI